MLARRRAASAPDRSGSCGCDSDNADDDDDDADDDDGWDAGGGGGCFAGTEAGTAATDGRAGACTTRGDGRMANDGMP